MPAAIILCLILIGCNRGAKQQAQPTPEVSTIIIAKQPVSLSSELPGRTSAYMVAEIRPQVNGIIKKRLFEEGSDVKAGQPLYEIDQAPFNAALNIAKANLLAAKETAERAKAALEASIAGVDRQKATLDLSKADLKRIENLYNEKVVSQSQMDAAKTANDVADATLKATLAQVESDRKAVEAAKAAVKQAGAALETAQINLGYTNITAPVSGRIGKSNVTVGALVMAYQAVALATIQQIDPIYVDVTQSTTELFQLKRTLSKNGIKEDDPELKKVKLILEDDTEYSLDGELKFRDISVDQSTGSYLLRIVFANPEGLLLPGMFVRTKVSEGTDKEAILIPQQAVLRNPKGNPMALIATDTGKAEQRMLTLDRAIGDKWLVVSGLSVGERLIVDNLQKVRDGSTIKEIQPDEAAKNADKPANAPEKPENKPEGGK